MSFPNSLDDESSDHKALIDSTVEPSAPEKTCSKTVPLFVLFVISAAVLYTVLRNYADDEGYSPIIPSLSLELDLKATDFCSISNERRFDCFPRGLASQKDCEARGCCWVPTERDNNAVNDINIPWCFYPENTSSYSVIKRSTTILGEDIYLNLSRPSFYPRDVKVLKISVQHETKNRLRVRFTDNSTTRYEPQIPEVPIVVARASNPVYEIIFNDEDFGFAVVRKNTKTVIFDASSIGNFVFSDQFLQLSAFLPSKYVYGLGELRNNFLLNFNWNELTLLNHDSPPVDKVNLYGTQPFYLAMEGDGNAHGVFLLNSNAMDIILQPAPAITYRSIGGILDLYFLLGPGPKDVVQQYQEVVGYPFIPPYWSLGFHLCKFGLQTLNETVDFWRRNRELGIPFDVQWNDIDYMENHNDFTIDKRFNNLSSFVKQLHDEGMRYVVILDPGVASREPAGTYPPFDQGMTENIFIRNSSDLPLEGEVWNKLKGTVFPDFTNPKTTSYWSVLVSDLYKRVPFDGLWLDMNDISNFVNGSLQGCNSPNNILDNPPYTPNVQGGHLNFRTICMSGRHATTSHYNVHNLYGFFESVITNFALSSVLSKRPFVLTRSTFSGSGKFAAHWTGDVFSRWDDMKHSVGDIMSFSIFGIPMVGADICGFNEDATEELCQRWSQLGAFYPFSRNHNSDDTKPQDPASFSQSMIESTKKALNMRYKLLPYLYTLFWNAHTSGETVIRPLFFEFPHDKVTYEQNTQFMWGPALLIVPVLTENATKVTTYFPEDIWFDVHTLEAHRTKGEIVTIEAPMDRIPLFFRAGHIVPFQEPNVTTTLSRRNSFGLYVPLTADSFAVGSLYWDDGEYLLDDLDVKFLQNVTEKKIKLSEPKHNFLEFRCTGSSVTGLTRSFKYNSTMILDTVHIMGITGKVENVLVNNRNHTDFQFVQQNEVLSIQKTNIDLSIDFRIEWK